MAQKVPFSHQSALPKCSSALHHPFLSFPCVCPEPVLVKWSFLYTNGSKRGISRTAESKRTPQDYEAQPACPPSETSSETGFERVSLRMSDPSLSW